MTLFINFNGEIVNFSDKELNEKSGELTKNGFKYNFDRDIYYNVGTQTLTSLEYVEDHPIQEIKKKLRIQRFFPASIHIVKPYFFPYRLINFC